LSEKEQSKSPSEIQNIEDDIRQKQPRAIDNVPKELEEILKTLQVSIKEDYSGAIPHPKYLKAFNEIVPGSAGLIFQEFKHQSEHRRKLEAYVIPRQIDQSGRGQIIAFIVVLLFLISGVVLTMYDHDVVGGIVLGTSLVAVATVFITGKISQEKDIASKKS
jgi:uncharacterized membrane protein